MPRTLVLHIGAMKTGTTWLQELLHLNRSRLNQAGWVVPQQERVVRATRDLLALADSDAGSGMAGRGRELADADRWVRMLSDVDGRAEANNRRGVVLSMEFLSYARPQGVARLKRSVAGFDLHVVLTVRDAARALPSQWQSLSRNGHAVSWPEFAAAARSSEQQPPPPSARPFRRTQDIPRMLRTWSAAVPPERFTVITVPGAPDVPRTVLWERFCAVLGVDAALTRTDAAFENPQLGYGSIELLRRVNGSGLGDVQASDYRRVMRVLTHEHLLHVRGEQSRPRLDRTTMQFATDLNARTLAGVAKVATLVGDPADLPTTVAAPAGGLDPGDLPVQVSDAEVRGSADVLLAGALEVCETKGLTVPPELAGPLPVDLDAAVDHLGRLLVVAMGPGAPDERPAG